MSKNIEQLGNGKCKIKISSPDLVFTEDIIALR